MDILIDVDGVVADFVGGLLDAINSSLKATDITVYWMFELLSPEERKQATSIMSEPSFWRCLRPIDRAIEGVEKLREAGHSILWATHPWSCCRGWCDARRDWLYQHFAADDDEILFGSAKYRIAGDVLIDDNPKFIKSWQIAYDKGCALLYSQPYNRSFHWPENRQFTWEKLFRGEFDELFDFPDNKTVTCFACGAKFVTASGEPGRCIACNQLFLRVV